VYAAQLTLGKARSKSSLHTGPSSAIQRKKDNMGFLYWIIVGLIAGWLAGKVMKGEGYGVLVDIILGILGAVVGGWVFSLLGFHAGGLIATIIVAFVGAVILVWIVRKLK
jgi:uncharacterized membrane protein YeaQ/YmgE (transglycosylase-associated protein family)